MSKSKRTQRRHRKANVGQTKLDAYLGTSNGIAALANKISCKTAKHVSIPIPENTVILNSSESASSESDPDNQIVAKRP